MLYSDDIWGPEEFQAAWALSAEEFLATIPVNFPGVPADYALAARNIQVRVK